MSSQNAICPGRGLVLLPVEFLQLRSQMDRRPRRDDQFVLDADPLHLAADRAAGRVQGERLDGRLRIGRRVLHRAEQPLVAFAGRAGQHVLGGSCSSFSAWFFCNRSMFSRPSFTSSTMSPRPAPPGLRPCRRDSSAVVRRQEDQPVAPMTRLGAVVCACTPAPHRRLAGPLHASTNSRAAARQVARRCRPARRRAA